MIPADVLNSLKALALTQRPLVTATAQTNAIAAFQAGQTYQASVQAQLAPGIYKVLVADQLLQLQLPGNIRSGDSISLQVISLLPRLTFNMATSANPLSTSDQLGATARLLSSLTEQPLAQAYVRPSNSAPLWTGAAQFPETTELAGMLHAALSQSGLFYEAHQAQWLTGSRNTAQLLQEPQNLSPDQAKIAMSNTSSTAQSERISIPGVPEHLQPIIHQQLNVLETRQVQWQGQVWLNQEMRWTIQEQPARMTEGDEQQQWSTEIYLNLPNLGEITATLRFAATGLSITIDAVQDSSRSKLGAASTALVSSMTDAGIAITAASVKQPQPVAP